MKSHEFFPSHSENLITPEQIELKVEQLKEIPLVQKAFELLDALPNDLVYHNKDHTDDVFQEVVKLGLIDRIDESELQRYAIAAAWHDVGYVIKTEHNESDAIELFRQNAPKYSIGPEDQKTIETIIKDTELHLTEEGPIRKTDNEFSAYVLDADVANFGRSDFREKTNLVAQEAGVDLANREERLKFLEFTIKLLKNHKWHTNAALGLWQAQKLVNITELEQEIVDMKFI